MEAALLVTVPVLYASVWIWFYLLSGTTLLGLYFLLIPEDKSMVSPAVELIWNSN